MKKTALYEVHQKLGARMVPFAGYEMPVRYASEIEEHVAVRKGVGIFDVSHMGEFMVKGPKALDLIQKISSNDASKLFPGKVQYAYIPNTTGGVVDDLLIYMLKDEEYMLVVNASNIEKDWDWIVKHNDVGAELENISENISMLAIQGPKAIEVIQKITRVDLSKVPYYTFVKGNIGDITDGVVISATGYTGSKGFELYMYNEYAVQIWEKVMEAGAEFDIKPAGLGARDTLRLEMGYCLYGHEIDENTSPIEAGLDWVTKFTKDFIGSSIIKDQKSGSLTQQLIGFVLEERGVPRQGYELLDGDDNVIGKVTSGTMSPSLNVGIGLGYVKKEFSTEGTKIYVGVRNRKLSAMVSKLPFFKS